MDEQKVRESIKDAYGMLKDFQKSTVKNVLYNLYEKGPPEDRHLVADEVGLGKTIVAKGVIAKRVEKILNSDHLEKRFRVVYICSNQAIARQNIHKLNVFGGRSLQRTNMDRLVFLALNDKTKTYSNGLDFQITALTPSTSFEVKKGTGIRTERKLIWLLLTRYEVFRRNGRKEGLKYALLGNVTPDKEWSKEIDRYAQKNKTRIVSDIRIKFREQVRKSIVDLSEYRYSIIKEELNYRDDQKSIQEILIDYSELLTVNNVESEYTGQKKILGRLREILTDICTDYLEADLFILDEFQRFKKLIDTVKENEELSDAAKIAKKVFNRTDAKVLMLSATPFKPYSTSLEQELGESHFEEFKTVLEFLLNDEQGNKLNNFADLNQKVRDVLRRPNSFLKGNLTEPIASKNKLESIYQKVVSRTERIIVSEDKNTMLQSKRFPNSILSKKEIEHFRAVDSLAQTLKEEGIGGHFNMMKYFKSCPYTFSYLDGYKIKEELKEALERNNSVVKKAIHSNSKAWLDLKEIRNYSLDLSESPNLKLRNFGATAFENNLWKQLWLPPSLPYYTQRGAFEGAKNSSKMLLFSKWRMVPRMISSLISYEAERSVLTNLAQDEKEELSYFKNSDSSRRTPSPILQLKTNDAGPASMRTFTLLYPSLTLSEITTVRENAYKKGDSDNDYFRLKNHIKESIKTKIKEANIQQFASDEKVSPDWYWAAPILLDKYYHADVYDSWLTDRRIENSLIYGNRDIKPFGDAISDDKSNPTTNAHIEEIIKLYNNPAEYELGGFPDIDKLAEALSLMVIGSPANATFRTFELFYNTTDKEHEETITHLNYALDIAYEFRSLFDKPESISIIRNFNSGVKGGQTSSSTYWYNVLQYCVDGNLQAVFDEFGHALNPESENKEYFFERFIKTINIRTSLIKVDDANKVTEGKSEKLRCHYAVPFGNQNMESETGKKRVQNVLENFNSPFRPFILASTSLGQEGLDFHHYCRKVVHWNLPHNPVDLEQREGRVNRFKCLAIRQNLEKKYSRNVLSEEQDYRHTDIWEALFSYAKEEEKESPDLIPYWHLEGSKEKKDQVSIERIVPLFPYSKEEPKFEELKKTLALYRLTFGQPRQEELVDALSDAVGKEELKKIRENLMINLCPHIYD